MNPAGTYALVIGINTYDAAGKYQNLRAACNDADNMDSFLRRHCKVPAENIINLRDKEATRQGILEGFKKLEDITEKFDKESADTPEVPRPRPCMIIFFAGHGARTEKPKGWGDWAPESDQVEMLCPSDIGMALCKEKQEPVVDDTKVVEGIPDRTVCWLLNQLSEKRGNNITLILDCCNSAGLNRGDKGQSGKVFRRILHPPTLSGKADPLVDWSLTDEEKMDEESSGRAVHQFSGFGGKFHESHVLLSACGKEQAAGEDGGAGVFSSALLKVLTKEMNDLNCRGQTLTYATLMSRLSMPKEQTPHCEGSNINKLLFTRQGPRSDPSFIPCRKAELEKGPDGKVSKWVLVLDAGEAQGIGPGESFSIHQNNIAADDKNPRMGVLCTTRVSAATSILARPPSEPFFRKPSHFYAVRIDWSRDPPKLFCENRAWLSQVFPQGDPNKPITIVDDRNVASLILEVTGNTVTFSRNDSLLEKFQVPRTFGRTITDTKHEAIRAVVGGLQHFNSHLHRTGAPFPDVKMELHYLEEIRDNLTEQEAQQPENFRPQGEDLLRSEFEATTLKLPDPEFDEKPLGVTLYNSGKEDLYPYLFYFDPNELTISPWYLAPVGAGNGKVDPPLKRGSKFCIGYGNGAAAPWSFYFGEGRTKDIGYFKLFLSVSPINFESLIREASPFDSGLPRRGNASGAPDTGDFKWGAKLFTIIQELEDSPATAGTCQ